MNKNYRYYIFDAYSKLIYESKFSYESPELAQRVANKHILISQLAGNKNWIYSEIS